jgi:putative ABC transport system permease protein
MSSHRLLHLIRLSLHSLVVNRLRSVLTVLGIVLGVASVIVMLAIGEAARFEAIRQIELLGATNIIVRSVKPPDDGKQSPDQLLLTYGVTRLDMERLLATLPTVRAATPLREFRKDIRHHGQQLEARVVSVLPDFQAMNGLTIANGRFISQTDNDRFENVVVLGAETAEVLFPLESPVGQSIYLDNGAYYRVIGVTARRAASGNVGSSLAGQDYNRDVYIPFDTDRVRNGSVLIYFKAGTVTFERIEMSQLTIEVDRMENVQATAELIRGTLEQFHPRKDYEITVPLDLLARAEKAQRVFTLVLGAIGSISLIVGGIGIMNIMLATVTERTREIGIRRALGAKRRDIIMQFLIEAVVQTTLGGFIGVGMGLLVMFGAPLIARIFSKPLPSTLEPWSIVISLVSAVTVGVLAGLYPAYRASRLDPIEALRVSL